MQIMKAVRIHEYGGPEVLRYEEAPRPQVAAATELLIHVHGAGVNPIDWKIREGRFQDRITYSLPFIPGWDLSGVVEATGPDVTKFQKGDEVFSRPDIARNGAYAEYIVVRESEVAFKPKSLDHVHAAGIPLAALTAWQAIFDTGGLSAGEKILIQAASGGVGSIAVQLAKWKGAHVFGTSSGPNQSFIRELGVDDRLQEDAIRGRGARCRCRVRYHRRRDPAALIRSAEERRHPCFYYFAAVTGGSSQTCRAGDAYFYATKLCRVNPDSRPGGRRKG
jgi:NADPH:quinone reductase-like Zn-dependent oxidoreductase